jgi:hypothetical protein
MKRLLFALVSAAALWAAACSSGGSNIPPPPPAGNYKLTSLNGTYAFTTSGTVITSTGGTIAESSLARVGSFSADGAGGIKAGGVYDVVSSGGSGTTPSVPNPITGGSYTVNPDGRGTLSLNINSGGSPGSINFAFVLTSASSGVGAASDGLMIDETSNSSQASTGSGNFVLQNTAAFGISNISGSYVFDFTGLDATQPPSGPNPESLVGQFTATNSGVISTGFEDSNDAGALNSGSIAPGNLTPDPTNISTSGRGTANIAGQSYVFYIVDSTRLRFISSNVSGIGPMLTGDAVSQSAALVSPTSDFAFLVAGSDSGGNGLIRVGRFTVSGTTLNNMLMDVNDAANENQFNALSNGTIIGFDTTTGRGQLSFQDSGGNTYTFVFYLRSQSDGVIQEITGVAGSGTAVVVADGSLAAQSGKPFSGSNITGTYAMNWSGQLTANGTTDEEDLLSQVKVSNLSLSGTSDIYQFTSNPIAPNLGLGTTGQIMFNNGDGAGDDTKRVDLNVNLSGISKIDMVVYIVNPQLAFFANRDNSDKPRIVAGILKAQQ